MGKNPQSPLSPALQKKFKALDYYQPDERYRFELALQKYANPEGLQMETSTGGVQDYLRIGYLEFEHPDNKKMVKIHVYQSANNPDYYFVPFRDGTSNDGRTYGAGRYMEIEEHGDKFVLDFNMAYSPFCAYSANFTCPLPPMENWLEEEILAGEKAFPLADEVY